MDLRNHPFADVLQEREANPRWKLLDQTADFVVSRLRAGKLANLLFVCTHNSRRSQFAHAWAHVFADLLGLDAVRSYSGGTEVTACNERTIAALQRFGFEVRGFENDGCKVGDLAGENPDFELQFPNARPLHCNSSLFHEYELQEFAAMMCCSDVDAKCPTVPGAATRIPLHYDDPKVSDDSPDEVSCYDQRCRQIGRDMLLLMSEVAIRRKSDSQSV